MTRKKDIEVEINDLENDAAETEPSDTETATDTTQPTENKADEQSPAAEVSEEERLRARVAELEDRLLRAAADFDNYKKRQARMYEEMIRNGNDRVLADLLEIVDNFERAIEHASSTGDNGNDAVRKGAELILTQMKDLLARYDVTPIESLGKPFDPNLHEALMQVESNDYDEGVIALEINRGYKRGDRVIRHARVGVSSGPPSAE